MRLFQIWLILLSMFFCMSVAAVTIEPVAKVAYNSLEPVKTPKQQSLTNLSITTHSEQPESQFEDIYIPRIGAPRATLFLSDSQTNAEFKLLFEFSPPDLAAGRYWVSPIALHPWYIHSSYSAKTRISGWKDTNTLYATLDATDS